MVLVYERNKTHQTKEKKLRLSVSLDDLMTTALKDFMKTIAEHIGADAFVTLDSGTGDKLSESMHTRVTLRLCCNAMIFFEIDFYMDKI